MAKKGRSQNLDETILKMSETIIKVENLGKKYIIGHQQQEKYTALRFGAG